jgi:hypothetical protein
MRGVLGKVLPKVRQTFERFEVKGGASNADDARFDYFVKTMWPRIHASATSQVRQTTLLTSSALSLLLCSWDCCPRASTSTQSIFIVM